jgi:hypothetical protein
MHGGAARDRADPRDGVIAAHRILRHLGDGWLRRVPVPSAIVVEISCSSGQAAQSVAEDRRRGALAATSGLRHDAQCRGVTRTDREGDIPWARQLSIRARWLL